MKILKEWLLNKYTLLFYIIVSMIIVTGLEILFLTPIILSIKFFGWFLLLYLPIIGSLIGFFVYINVE